MKVLIADDHGAIRTGLKHILKQQFRSIEFEEAADAAEVMRLTKKGKLDFVMLDINMPGRNGLEILTELRGKGNHVPVLVFSFHNEDQVAIRALKAGANGFLSKEAPDTEIIKAMKQILAGRKYITLSVAELMSNQLGNTEEKEPHTTLSDREFQTLLKLAAGKTVSQISVDLSLSVHTISTYRTRVLEKMLMKTNAELTRYAIENRLI